MHQAILNHFFMLNILYKMLPCPCYWTPFDPSSIETQTRGLEYLGIVHFLPGRDFTGGEWLREDIQNKNNINKKKYNERIKWN